MLTRRNFVKGCMVLSAAPVSLPAIAGSTPKVRIRPIASGIWMHTSWKLLASGKPFPSNGLIVRGKRQALIIDTTWPTRDMASLVRKARELTNGLPLQLAITHAHDDRMSGVEIARRAGIPSLAHALTQEDARSREIPLADVVWSGDRKVLQLGARKAELFWPGHAHTRDNIVVFIEDAGVLFGGCMLRAMSTKSLGNVADANVQNWSKAVARIVSEFGKKTRFVIPGHGEPGGPELLAHTKALADAAVKERN